MEALDGPFKGKFYQVPNETQRIIDHWYDELLYLHKVIYQRTDEGWKLVEHTNEGQLH